MHGFLSTLVKLALACLFVGFLLAFFEIDPARFRNEVQHSAMLGMQWNRLTTTSI